MVTWPQPLVLLLQSWWAALAPQEAPHVHDEQPPGGGAHRGVYCRSCAQYYSGPWMGSREVIVTYMSHVNEAGVWTALFYVVFSQPFPQRWCYSCDSWVGTCVLLVCTVPCVQSFFSWVVSFATVFLSHLYLLSTPSHLSCRPSMPLLLWTHSMTFSLPTRTGKERNSFQQWKACACVGRGGQGVRRREGKRCTYVFYTFVSLDALAPLCLCKYTKCLMTL